MGKLEEESSRNRVFSQESPLRLLERHLYQNRKAENLLAGRLVL